MSSAKTSKTQGAKRVFLINCLRQGGAERLVIDDVNAAFRMGEDVLLVTLSPERVENSLISFCVLPGERRIYLPIRSLYDLRGWWRLFRWFQRTRPYVVYTHLWYANFIGRITAVLAGVPVIISFEHNVYDRLRRSWQFFLDAILAHWTTKIIAVSSSVQESLLQHHIPSKKIVVLPNAIDLTLYRPNIDRKEIRRTLKIPEGALLGICVARLVQQKGQDILLSSLADESMSVVHLILVGEGMLRVSLEQQAAELGLTERIHFLGARTDVPQLLASSDFFILPSRWEGLPIALLEAMAAGLPVIATAVNGTKEVIRSEEEGILIPPEQPEKLRQAIAAFINNPSLRTKLATGSFHRAQDFSIERHVQRLFDLDERPMTSK